jgi:hypothetical protein
MPFRAAGVPAGASRRGSSEAQRYFCRQPTKAIDARPPLALLRGARKCAATGTAPTPRARDEGVAQGGMVRDVLDLVHEYQIAA